MAKKRLSAPAASRAVGLRAALLIAVVAFGCRDIVSPTSKNLQSAAAISRNNVIANPIDTNRTFYGPAAFLQTGATPLTFSNSVSTLGYAAPFTLHVRNGNLDGSAPVSGATVTLDGVVIMSPADFKPHKADYSFPVTMGISSSLQITMAGTDSGYVTISVDGKAHARFCPAATGDGLGYQTLQMAIDSSTTNETIWVCDGAHSVNEAHVNKPLTIRAENPGMATLVQPASATAGQAILDVNGVVAGKNRFLNLGLQFTQQGMHLHGAFDTVAVIATTFTGPGVTCTGPNFTIGLATDTNSVATAKVSVHRSTFTLSCEGLASGEPVDIDTYNSTFSTMGTFGLIYSSGNSVNLPAPGGTPLMRTGRVINNTFTNCGPTSGACIAIESAGTDTVSGNHLIMTSGHANDGIFLNHASGIPAVSRPIIVTGNTLTGVQSGPDSLVSSWSYSGGIVENINSNGAGTRDVVSGNHISGAYAAISVRSTSTLQVSDNFIDSNYVAFFVASNNAQLFANRNDVSHYTAPIFAGVLAAPPAPTTIVAPVAADGSMTCNWWGDAGGPANVFPSTPLALYAPYSTARIAGKPGVGCDPTVPVTTVRACATTNGSGVPTFPTIPAAYSAAPNGGTVLICNGNYTVSDLTILKPVTITAEGAGMPTLDAGPGGNVFDVGHVPGGPVTISYLRFTGGIYSQISVRAISSPQEGAIANIIHNEFHPPHEVGQAGPSGGIDITNLDSGTVNVDSNTFIGGDAGVQPMTSPGAAVNIRWNSFNGQSSVAVAVSNVAPNSVYDIEGNTFINCPSFVACVTTNYPARIAYNTFTARIAQPIGPAIYVFIQNGNATLSQVIGNTITGIGSKTKNRLAATSYPVQAAAIGISGGIAIVSGNQITNAYRGIDGWQGAVVTASDNVIQTTATPLSADGDTPSTFTANWNDFTDYTDAFANPNLLNLTPLNLRCNWWGQAAGPTSISVIIQPTAYTPVATASVAGGPHTGCSP